MWSNLESQMRELLMNFLKVAGIAVLCSTAVGCGSSTSSNSTSVEGAHLYQYQTAWAVEVLLLACQRDQGIDEAGVTLAEYVERNRASFNRIQDARSKHRNWRVELASSLKANSTQKIEYMSQIGLDVADADSFKGGRIIESIPTFEQAWSDVPLPEDFLLQLVPSVVQETHNEDDRQTCQNFMDRVAATEFDLEVRRSYEPPKPRPDWRNTRRSRLGDLDPYR